MVSARIGWTCISLLGYFGYCERRFVRRSKGEVDLDGNEDGENVLWISALEHLAKTQQERFHSHSVFCFSTTNNLIHRIKLYMHLQAFSLVHFQKSLTEV